MRKIYFIFTFCLILLFASFYGTYSYFSDSKVSGVNTYTTASIFPTKANIITPIDLVTTPNATPPDTLISEGDVVINEVYYDPDADHTVTGSDPANSSEWIELYNRSSKDINLKGWKIVDNFGPERLLFADNKAFKPGEFIILAKETNVVAEWGFSSDIFVALKELVGNGLANSSDRVILKDNSGQIIDQISYGGDITAFNPSLPDVAQGHSLERDPDGQDTNSPTDFVNRDIPTPGN